MQQFCSNCGSAIQPGSAVCSNCGTPVSSGSGAYDPTVRAGTPPGTGYGSQPYGAPSPQQPYGTPPPIDYGAGAPPPPPQQGYGSQPYGTPPPQQGFGAPPPPPPGFAGQPYGGPPPIMPVQQPPQKKSRTLWYVLGAIAVVLIICCVGGGLALRAGLFAASNAVNTAATQIAKTANAIDATATADAGSTPTQGPFTQTSTTGTHITKIQTGTGWDQSSGAVQGETASFHPGDTVYTVFTVDLKGTSSAKVEIKYLLNGSQTDTSGPQSITESNVYSYNSAIGTTPGVYTIEVDFNNTPEATITVQVLSS